MTSVDLIHVRPFGARHQAGGGNVEGSGDLDDVRQRDVTLAALDLTHVREVEAGSPAQLLLAPLQLLPFMSDLVAECDVGWAERFHSPRSLYPRAFPV